MDMANQIQQAQILVEALPEDSKTDIIISTMVAEALKTSEIEHHMGIIDLFLELEKSLTSINNNNEQELDKIFDKLNLDDFIIKTNIENLSLMTAGCFDKK